MRLRIFNCDGTLGPSSLRAKGKNMLMMCKYSASMSNINYTAIQWEPSSKVLPKSGMINTIYTIKNIYCSIFIRISHRNFPDFSIWHAPISKCWKVPIDTLHQRWSHPSAASCMPPSFLAGCAWLTSKIHPKQFHRRCNFTGSSHRYLSSPQISLDDLGFSKQIEKECLRRNVAIF